MTKTKITPESTYDLFHTSEPMKKCAARLGVSPNTLRAWWAEHFGEEALVERGSEIQKSAARQLGSSKKGTTYNHPTTAYNCVDCTIEVHLNSLQIAKLAKILCDACQNKARGVDRECPVCQLGVSGLLGLSTHLRQKFDEAHVEYLKLSDKSEWFGKSESIDFVVCKICNFRDSTLGRHLGAVHQLTADQYRRRFPGAQIVSERTCEQRSISLIEAHKRRPQKGLRKTEVCDGCNVEMEVSAFTNIAICQECCEAEELERRCQKWHGKSELEDYVTCQECNYVAENLTSHLQNAHPDLIGCYQDKFPGHLIVALNSSIRDKTALQGRPLSAETKELMSRNAGRWNLGLTTETDERVARGAENMNGRPSWSKGLTKESHPSLKSTAEKLQQYAGENRPWSNGLEASLTYADFAPFLESDGVDRTKMAEALGYSEETITKYMRKLGLVLSKNHIQGRALAATIRLEKSTLETHALKNGKIQVGCVMKETGHDRKVILRECNRHGLVSYTRSILQGRCLTAVSQVLGGVEYKREWEARRFVNPKSGFRFRFDGYFPTHNLITEFFGHQHYKFPSIYVKTEEAYFDLQERDRIKENLARADGIHYLVIREDEPFDDESYLRGRLEAEGVKL